MAARTALVIGATGLIGKALVTELLQSPAYSKVAAVVRRPLPFSDPRLDQRIVDLERMEAAADAFAADDIFCALGTTIKKAGSRAAFRRVDFDYPMTAARLAKEQGARQYLLVSSLGADPHSRVFYTQVKGELEEALQGVGLEGLHIFRPSLLLGEREVARPGEEVAAVVMKGVSWALVGPLSKYRAITGQAVARAMVRKALEDQAGVHIYLSDAIAAMAGGQG